MKNKVDYYSFDSMKQFKEIADQCFSNHQDSRAKEYYLRAKRILDQMDETTLVAYYLQNNRLGQILIQKRNYEEAKNYYQWIISRIRNTKYDELGYVTNAYLKLANLSMVTGNQEEMNQYYWEAYQWYVHTSFGEKELFVEFEVFESDSLDYDMASELLKYGRIVIEKEKGKNSEEYYISTVRLASYLSDQDECRKLYDEAIVWIRKHRDNLELEKLLKGIVENLISLESYYNLDYYFPKLLEIIKVNDGENSLDYILNDLKYNKYIQLYSEDVNAPQKGLIHFKYDLSRLEIYYPFGSQEYYDQYREIIILYLYLKKQEQFGELVQFYRNRLIDQYGLKSAEVKEFNKDLRRIHNSEYK